MRFSSQITKCDPKDGDCKQCQGQHRCRTLPMTMAMSPMLAVMGSMAWPAASSFTCLATSILRSCRVSSSPFACRQRKPLF